MGVPVVIILQDLDPTGRYLGLCLLVFMIPMCTMGLIMAPKMYLVHHKKSDSEQGSSSTMTPRGTRPSVDARVSGIDIPTRSTQTSNIVMDALSPEAHPELKPDQIQTVTMH